MKSIAMVIAGFIACASMSGAWAQPMNESEAAGLSDFVWSFPLDAEPTATAHRLVLTPEIMQRLYRLDARDLMVADANGQSVSFARVPNSMLLERLEQTYPLIFEGALVQKGQAAVDDLTLAFEHQGSRLEFSAPSGLAPELAIGQIQFEALLGLSDSVDRSFASDSNGSDSNASESGDPLQLELEFQTNQTLSMVCWLRDANSLEPATKRMPLRMLVESRPRRYIGHSMVSTDTQAWHLACYGNTSPDDLELVEARVFRVVNQSYQAQTTLKPEMLRATEPTEQLFFELPGPYRSNTIQLSSDQANVLSLVQLFSRLDENDRWRKQGEFTLSSIQAAENEVLNLDGRDDRHQQWKIEAEPTLGHVPQVNFQAELETLVFLAQGEPPWRLLVGSRKASQNSLNMGMLSEMNDNIGAVWKWPEVGIGQAERLAEDSLLEPPAMPLEWSNYLLWIVLILGSLLVSYMAFALLRSPKD